MARSRLWKLVGSAVVAISSGCALCDTCNEPPVPCTGPGCSAAMNIAPAPYGMQPGAGSFAPGMMGGVPTAPPSEAQTTPSFTVPPLPEVPAESPPPPPDSPATP